MMDNYSTFYTITHKGVFIHAKYNNTLHREEYTVNSPINGISWHGYSLRAAKLACSRVVKAINKGHPVNYPQHIRG